VKGPVNGKWEVSYGYLLISACEGGGKRRPSMHLKMQEAGVYSRPTICEVIAMDENVDNDLTGQTEAIRRSLSYLTKLRTGHWPDFDVFALNFIVRLIDEHRKGHFHWWGPCLDLCTKEELRNLGKFVESEMQRQRDGPYYCDVVRAFLPLGGAVELFNKKKDEVISVMGVLRDSLNKRLPLQQ
jgi:hypothetical protein